MIKLNSETYIELFKDWPDYQMTLSGWDYDVKYYLLGLVAVVIYTKALTK